MILCRNTLYLRVGKIRTKSEHTSHMPHSRQYVYNFKKNIIGSEEDKKEIDDILDEKISHSFNKNKVLPVFERIFGTKNDRAKKLIINLQITYLLIVMLFLERAKIEKPKQTSSKYSHYSNLQSHPLSILHSSMIAIHSPAMRSTVADVCSIHHPTTTIKK